MKQYLDLLDDILSNGFERKDRTGTGTIGVFGRMLRFPMKDGFPLLTTKKIHLRSVIHELLWFLKGDTNIKYLKDNGVTIWDEWADENGNLGPIYGKQWRDWNTSIGEWENLAGIDQIAEIIHTLKTNPDSRRIMVSAWNIDAIREMKLPPCHYGFQISTRELSLQEKNMWAMEHIRTEQFDGNMNNPKMVPQRAISLMWNQRSVDTALGLPFNIASYALLLMMIGQVVNMIPEDLICSLGDTHLYKNHIEGVKEQLKREPLLLPKMILTLGHTDMDNWKYEDFKLTDYEYHPSIKFPISV